ncbi:late competence protein ComER [Evansella sp. AB-rgal1]|uniref:late competence protein ComER n=1 Tax=Evansella sp. AB-rgal1 TaxID=3242696 RepID=UPI00359E9D31
MKKIGFIGTGSMGNILISSFLDAKAIAPNNVYVTNRTLKKAHDIASQYDGVHVVEDVKTLVKEVDYIFLCVKPLQMIPLLEEVKHCITKEHTLISITSPLLVEELENTTDAKVIRFIPSIVNRALDGPSLVTFGKTCSDSDKECFLSFVKKISRPEIIDNNITRVASDIGCCGPAFISFIVEQMIQSAVEETEISKEEATTIMESMLIGYGELLRQKHFTLETLRERVTVPGGVTGVGLDVLRAEVGKQFNKMFVKTHEKYDEDRRLIHEQLNKSPKINHSN